jgi:hypothetical protein
LVDTRLSDNAAVVKRIAVDFADDLKAPTFGKRRGPKAPDPDWTPEAFGAKGWLPGHHLDDERAIGVEDGFEVIRIVTIFLGPHVQLVGVAIGQVGDGFGWGYVALECDHV